MSENLKSFSLAWLFSLSIRHQRLVFGHSKVKQEPQLFHLEEQV